MKKPNVALTKEGVTAPGMIKSDLAYLKEEPNALKVRIERGQKLGFTRSETSENFWCHWVDKAKGLAEVKNVCMCKLGYGDIIKVEPGEGYRYKFVDVEQKKVNVSYLGCPLFTDSRGRNLSIDRFIAALEALDNRDIKAELISMCPECANATLCIQRPTSMSKEDFRAYIDQSPLALTEVKNLKHSH